MSTPSPLPAPLPAAIPENPRGRACASCAYVGAEGSVNVCKLYPPIMVPGAGNQGPSWQWPTVNITNDWCGQYSGTI